MTRSASHFCFVVFPPQSLLDVLKSRVMKRTSISYCAMRDFAISAMANSTTQNDSLVSRFSIYKSLLDVLESRVMKRTSISYWAVWENSRVDILGSKTSQCEVLGLRWQIQPNFCNSILLKIFYHYNVYIIMIFLFLLLEHCNINDCRTFFIK